MVNRLVLILLLSGCTVVETDGPDAQGYSWRKTGSSVPATVHRSEYTLNLKCNGDNGKQGCAVRSEKACDIYLSKDAPEWMEAHQRKHCDGWKHF